MSIQLPASSAKGRRCGRQKVSMTSTFPSGPALTGNGLPRVPGPPGTPIEFGALVSPSEPWCSAGRRTTYPFSRRNSGRGRLRSIAIARIRVAVQALTGSSLSGSLPPMMLAMNQMTSQTNVTRAPPSFIGDEGASEGKYHRPRLRFGAVRSCFRVKGKVRSANASSKFVPRSCRSHRPTQPVLAGTGRTAFGLNMRFSAFPCGVAGSSPPCSNPR